MSVIQRVAVEAGLNAERQLLDQLCADASRDSALLLWQPQDQALVMPRRLSRLPGFEAAQAQLELRGWPLALRDTGGEPVPQSPAVLNVALAYVFPEQADERQRIESAYLHLCGPMTRWLSALGLEPGIGDVPGSFCDGRFNVTLQQRKLAGTAQRWRRRPADGRLVVLAHAAVLMENQRHLMVELVNDFYRLCQIEQTCRADSHIALDECLPAAEGWTATAAIPDVYRQELASLGIELPSA